MKRDYWERDTDLLEDLPELETDEYSGAFSLEDILAEFSDPENNRAPRTEGRITGTDFAGFVSTAAVNDSADEDNRDEDRVEEDEISTETDMTGTEEVSAAEAKAENTSLHGEEPATESMFRPQEEPNAADDGAQETEEPKAEQPAEKTKHRRERRHRRQKVVEEFPDTMPEVQEPSGGEGNEDYLSLFRMFADREEGNSENGSGGTEPRGREGGDLNTSAAGQENDSADKSAQREPAAVKDEPLFAEQSPDFKDILREFMMGDQHPIYAEMPGIGKKANEPDGQNDDLADLDAIINSVIPKAAAAVRSETAAESKAQKASAEKTERQRPEEAAENEAAKNAPVPAAEPKPRRKLGLSFLSKSRTKREAAAAAAAAEEKPENEAAKPYPVEEDFPAESEEATEGRQDEGTSPPAEPDENGWDFMKDLAEAGEQTEETETAAEENVYEPAEEAEAAAEENAYEPAGRLQKLLHGIGSGGRSGKKRALNEPRAYARYEDFVPDEPEEKAKNPETEAASEAAGGNGETAQSPDTAGQERGADAEEDDEILYSGDFPSFGQWILNELMTVWIRINGIGDRHSTATMEDDSEDLGKEVNVANASRYYGSQVTMLRMRFQIGLVLIAILAYLTLGLPVSGMLKTAKVCAAMCLGLQLTIMLLCLDVVTNAAVNLTRRRFGADALAVLCCVISSLDALSVAVGGFGNPHIPLCLFSSLALMGILFSDLLSARALRKSTRVPAIGKRVYSVTAEEGVRASGDLTLLKSVRPSAGFVRRAEETPPDESLFSRSATVQLLAAILLSLLIALVKHSIGDMLYILSAVLSCAVPVTALLAFALPFFIGSGRIFSSGAAVAGWSGIHDIGCSRNLIVTDRDLFPEETISIESVRIFADDSAERVISFAGTMIAASGSGLAPCFAELMEKNNCRMRQVEDFQWLAGGGMQGRIEGSTVLCGSSDLMQLMNVKVPYRLVDRTTVLLAIDGVLYGIFKINYTGLPEIRTALQELIASNRHPIFAIRDFIITPDMLHEVFDVATDGYDFPPYGDRFRISEAKPSETSKISAVICREGLGPVTHLADTGRSMYVAVRMNLIITAAAAVLGMLLVFLKLIGTGEVSAWLPFVVMVLDAILVTLISLFMRF